jgi:hypothetical protein
MFDIIQCNYPVAVELSTASPGNCNLWSAGKLLKTCYQFIESVCEAHSPKLKLANTM